MKQFLLFTLIFCLSITGSAFAREIILDSNSRMETGFTATADTIGTRANEVLGFSVHVKKLVTETVKTEKGTFSTLDIPSFQATSTLGAPSLPIMNKLIEVPVGAEVNVKIIGHSEKLYDLERDFDIENPIFPRQPSAPKDGTVLPFAYQLDAYLNEGFQQEDLVSVTEVGMLRHMRLVQVSVSPVAYDPTLKSVKVFNDIDFEVTLKNANLSSTIRNYTNYSSPYFRFAENKIHRPESLSKLPGQTRAEAGYLIVSDRMFENSLAPFIAWKKKQGFKVKVGYTDEIGTTTSAIQSYIHGLYKNPSDIPAPSFVLFCGDHEQVPAFKGQTSSHITDLYYIDATNDNIPDMLSGRFSAKNVADFDAQIEKTLEYEQFKMPDKSFLSHVVLVAGWDSRFTRGWGWPQINYGTENYFNDKHNIKNPHVYLSSGSHQNESSIIRDIGNGCSYVNYTAHGSSTSWADPGLRISDINNMKNKGKYPLVVGNCCLTNKFEVGECFGEAWLRAKNCGGIGYIGGSNSTYWDEDLWWGVGNHPILNPNNEGKAPAKNKTGIGAYDSVFEGDLYTAAGMMLAGNLTVQESSSPRKKYYWEVYHLMGDPSLIPYMGMPKASNVTHPAEISAEDTNIAITGAPGAVAALTINGELIGSAVLGNNGKSTMAINGELKGNTADLVVTGRNVAPYISTISIK
jgi:hypothetical protein